MKRWKHWLQTRLDLSAVLIYHVRVLEGERLSAVGVLLSAVYSLLLCEIKSQKITSNQKKPKTPVSSARGKSNKVFSGKLDLARGFPIISVS